MDMSLPRRATRLAWTALAVGLLAVGAASEPSSGAGEPRKSPDLGEAVPTPIALSDPDGQELILEELSVRAAAHGMLSLTELELRFRNPHARRMEGRFSCVLPPGATVSRFAKEVNGILMEGEVVERLRANRIYDEILHQMRDPALLEQDQGNRFSARIFPIEPHATVRLVLSYTRLLPIERGVRTYVLPLRGMPRIERFSFRGMFSALPGETLITTADRGPRDGFVRPAAARHSSAEVISISEQSFIPRQDIEIRWRPEQDAPQARLLRAGEFYLAAFRVSGAAVQPARDARPSRRPWIVYVDTSASAAEGERHRIHALEELFSALEPTQPLDVVAFDQQVVPLLRGSAAEISSRIGPALRSRHFLGGTDLGLLLADVADRLARQPGAQVVIATDGVATMGSSDRVKLASAIRALPKATIHALALGSRQDAAFLRALTAGRGRIVEVPFSESLTRNARQAAAALGEPLGASFDVADAGAEWVYPSRLTDVRNDSEVIIVGKLRPAARAAVQLTGGGGTLSVESPETLPFATFEPLLEREAYRIYLEQLAERETAETSAAVRSALATEQVRISVEKRVLIPHTTMLVLETEEDYRRFGLDRRALAAILTIDAGGIARLDRREPRLLAQKPADIREERFELPIPSPMDELDRDLEPVAVSETARRSSDVASSPAPRASIIGRPPIPQPPERKRAQPDWTVPTPPSRSEVERLVAQLRRDPRDRSLYNSVSEGLVALSDWGPLRRIALQWQQFDPENPQVYELLGEAARHLDLPTESARVRLAGRNRAGPAGDAAACRSAPAPLRERRAGRIAAAASTGIETRPGQRLPSSRLDSLAAGAARTGGARAGRSDAPELPGMVWRCAASHPRGAGLSVSGHAGAGAVTPRGDSAPGRRFRGRSLPPRCSAHQPGLGDRRQRRRSARGRSGPAGMLLRESAYRLRARAVPGHHPGVRPRGDPRFPNPGREVPRRGEVLQRRSHGSEPWRGGDPAGPRRRRAEGPDPPVPAAGGRRRDSPPSGPGSPMTLAVTGSKTWYQ